jgi:hypothetical protein
LHVAGVGWNINLFEVLLRHTEGEKPLERNNIGFVLKETDWKEMKYNFC